MEVFNLKLENILESCPNQDLIESIHDKIKQYHDIREKLKVFNDKKRRILLTSELKQYKNKLTKAFTDLKLGLIHYKFMMVDESLNNAEDVHRFYNKEEFSEYCKGVEAFAQKFNNQQHIFLLITSNTVPPMLVCSQTESMVSLNKYYVHGWSEKGRKLYRYSNKVEW